MRPAPAIWKTYLQHYYTNWHFIYRYTKSHVIKIIRVQLHAHSVFKEYQLKISQLKELPITTSQYYFTNTTNTTNATSQYYQLILHNCQVSKYILLTMTLNELKEKMTCWTYEKDLVHVYLFQMFQFSFLNFIISNLPVGRFKSEFLSSGGEYNCITCS